MTECREYSDSRISTKLPEDLSESLGQNQERSLAATIDFIKKKNFKIKSKMPYCLITSL